MYLNVVACPEIENLNIYAFQTRVLALECRVSAGIFLELDRREVDMPLLGDISTK